MVQCRDSRVRSVRPSSLPARLPERGLRRGSCNLLGTLLGFLLLFDFIGGAHAYMARHSMKHIYQKQVEALEAQWRNAELTGNADELDRLLSDDYVGITVNGTVQTKEETLDRVKTHAMIIKKMDLSEMKAAIHGDTAVVTSKAEVDSDIDGTEATGTFRYTRVYLRQAGVWKIINFEATRISPRPERRGPPPATPPATDPSASHSPAKEPPPPPPTQQD